MYQHLTKLFLAGLVAAILTVGSAQAFHKGVVHGDGGDGPATDTQTQLDAILNLFEPKLVFVTAADTFDGDLGGLGGADSECQTAAETESLALAGEPAFMAWLSDSTATPTTRFTTLSLGPYYMLNGQIVASSFADLLDGEILNPISTDETGGGVPVNSQAWTGTLPEGDATIFNCADWLSNGGQGANGNATAVDGTWTSEAAPLCNTGRRLYCFEQ